MVLEYLGKVKSHKEGEKSQVGYKSSPTIERTHKFQERFPRKSLSWPRESCIVLASFPNQVRAHFPRICWDGKFVLLVKFIACWPYCMNPYNLYSSKEGHENRGSSLARSTRWFPKHLMCSNSPYSTDFTANKVHGFRGGHTIHTAGFGHNFHGSWMSFWDIICWEVCKWFVLVILMPNLFCCSLYFSFEAGMKFLLDGFSRIGVFPGYWSKILCSLCIFVVVLKYFSTAS